MTAPLHVSLRTGAINGSIGKRLLDMGLIAYTPCVIVSRTKNMVTLKIWGMTLALDNDLARQVQVTMQEEASEA